MARGLSVAVCIDERGGMLFGGKRQSRDRLLIEELINSTNGKIITNDFSSSLFHDYEDKVEIERKPYKKCKKGDVCFIENIPLSDFCEDIEELIIYNWNRRYPCDVKLEINPEQLGLSLVLSKEFTGSSHDKITKEIYRK